MDQLLEYCRSTDSNMAMIRTTPAGQHIYSDLNGKCTGPCARLAWPSFEVEVGNGSRKWMTLPSHRRLSSLSPYPDTCS